MTRPRTALALLAAWLIVPALIVTTGAPQADAATHRPHLMSARPCPSDDGGLNPCLWDASKRGDHHGRDFRTDRFGRAYHRTTPVGGHRHCWKHAGRTVTVFWCGDGFRARIA